MHKKFTKKHFFAAFVVLSASCIAPQIHAEDLRPLNSHSVNLSGKDFLRFFSSKDEAERERARLYLLGVQDASEGKSWCDYKRFKTITLQEVLAMQFKKLPSERLNERAATLITEILVKEFPCKK